jgi:GTP:adenosylcobinamide-phosphate guanylyltransferase
LLYNAIVTAGGLIEGEFCQQAGTAIKAMVQVGGRTLLERTLDALRGSGSIAHIALIAPDEVRGSDEAARVDHFITAHQSGVVNILAGLDHFQNDGHVVLCASDLPFISAAAIKDFLTRCPEGSAICYPVFEKKEIGRELMPGIPSFIRLKDGEFTGGSLFRLQVSLCRERISQIGKSFNARKSPLGMARLLGPLILLKFMMGQCRLDDVKRKAEGIMGAPCALVRNCDPVITVDIDDVSSYRFACEHDSTGKDTGISPERS